MEIVVEVSSDVKYVLLLSLFCCDEFDCDLIDTVFNYILMFGFFVFLYLVIGIAFTQAAFSLFIVFFSFRSFGLFISL